MQDVLVGTGYSAHIDFEGEAGMLVPDPGTLSMTVMDTAGNLLVGPIAIDPSLQQATVNPSGRVLDGQIQFSLDGETFFNVMPVADLVSGIEQTDGVQITDSAGNTIGTLVGENG